MTEATPLLDSAMRAAAETAMGERLTDLFLKDPRRAADFTFEQGGFVLDISKQKLTREAWAALNAFARGRGVEAKFAAMLAGEPVNLTEGRAVLHTALRAPSPRPDVAETQRRADDLADAIRAGRITGEDGRPIRAVLSMGIGGSDLGPRLVWDALRPAAPPAVEPVFVSNVDPDDRAEALARLDPRDTLAVVVSKSFTTQETLANAEAARAWLAEACGAEAAAQRFIAVTAKRERAEAFGVGPEKIFDFWDWVGGRFSVWSAVNLACAIALGPDVMAAMRRGAAEMDAAAAADPLGSLPGVLALVNWWNRTALGAPSRAVFAYSHRLRRLPDYLQQLEMESNGKSVRRGGEDCLEETAPVTWGGPGTLAQHAVFQLLHQGTSVHPCEFIAAAEPGAEPGAGRDETDAAARADHVKLLANAVAQAEALMKGRSVAEAEALLKAAGAGEDEARRLAPHQAYPGDRPSSFILMDRLTPERFGALLALYEHKTAIEGFLWDVNSFDQYGVELGKVCAGDVLKDLTGEASGAAHDPSTQALIARLKR